MAQERLWTGCRSISPGLKDDDEIAGLGDSELHLLGEEVQGGAKRPHDIRFLPGEEKNDAGLSQTLASCADVYVNDAFGSAHRAHASTTGVAEVLRRQGKPAVAGFLMEKELRFLGEHMYDAGRDGSERVLRA